jgi:hypothetical protein
MQLKLNAIGLMAMLSSLTSALPSNQDAVVGNFLASPKLEARQQQYSCNGVASNQLGACQNAIQDLRALEARGCSVWGKCC